MGYIKERSELSKLFSQMQNEIAEKFKEFVVDIYMTVDQNMTTFQHVMREIATHQRKDGSMSNVAYDALESVTGGLSYMEFMEDAIFNYSSYNDADVDGGMYDFEFSFNSMSEAFTHYTERAIQQFGAGKFIDEKIFRQLAIILIVQDYKNKNIKLSLRQLYYQMVSKNYIANKETEYKRVIDLTGNMREACVLELDEFADNTRFSVRYDYEHDPKDFIFKRLEENKYFRDSRENQEHYLEVWIEKEALRTVVKPITDQNDVPLFICRGYPSTSSLYDQATAIFRQTKDGRTADEIQEVTILYYGDHDPSGLQIPEAIERIFHEDYQMQHVHVVPCALSKAQINKFNLPPNPAKLTDPRADRYIAEHGTESWELDALPPQELQRIVRDNIQGRTDADVQHESRLQQQVDRNKIKRMKDYIRKNWDKIVEGENDGGLQE